MSEMEKYAVVLDDSKTKTAGVDKKCPKCAREVEHIEDRPWCPTCGFEPFEKRPETTK